MPQTILVVDDEAVARRFLKRALTEAGYEVMLANSGEEALAALSVSQPDLLLCPRGFQPSFAASGPLHLCLRESPGGDGQALSSEAVQSRGASGSRARSPPGWSSVLTIPPCLVRPQGASHVSPRGPLAQTVRAADS